ncbi:MAG: SMC-Scp complex subunit ScpB [Nitrospirae bacterium]|nr:SMC-Scp complex subunit ScpB [Nitrospirota bacterium]MBF0533764.1 SMC-Scp complex subunit ScpB [Nitrospirota bacterium]MBF0615527.1 SMC-Scp complex subunit ScpB [Nitrospirota bacterium]
MEKAEQTAIIEALLFIAGDPLSIDDIKRHTNLTDAEILSSLTTLINAYKDRNGGILVAEIAGGYQMTTNPAYAQWAKVLKKNKSMGKLSIAALETLSIVAYKQPITRVEIEEIRGVGSDWTLKILLERNLVKITGRKDAPGKPLLFGTTREFLQYFGLKNIADLPTLKEFTKDV